MSIKDIEKLESIELDVVLRITTKFHELGLSVTFVKPVSRGPIVSVFRFMPQDGTKVSQVEGLSDDLAIALGVEDVFIKRMPGESAIGVFVPNKIRTYVRFVDCVTNVWKVKDEPSVPLNFGVDYLGVPVVEDLTKLPHLLIAGSTGSGKSTLLSSIIASIIYCKTPEQVQFILSDTKNVEFGHFIGAPHLLFSPSTTVYQTLEQLNWAIEELETRLKRYGREGFRNIIENNKAHENAPDPAIVIIIDELADLMLHKGEKRGEAKIAQDKISTIVQKSRAAGIYFIAATQRPSVNIVAGSIKANFPARLTFRLPSEADSRTVIGTGGAEHLLSQGDMLYVSPNRPGLTRLHAPFAEIKDIRAAVDAAIRR